jgi:PadR family transcriptional regulator PadR
LLFLILFHTGALTSSRNSALLGEILRGEPQMNDPLALMRGTLDVLVLKTLSWGPMHGFEITSWLEARSGGRLDVEDSALYQALRRLEGRAQVRAEWGVTENNRQARYYRITAEGRALLRAETSRWVRYAETVTGILTAPVRS